METFFTGVAMIFIAGLFVSFVVICGLLKAEEEAEKRKTMRAHARRNQEKLEQGGD